MATAPTHPDEFNRLRSLAEHNLLDTQPEEVYDDITRLAAEICGTPIAAINLIAGDRHWSKSAYGFAAGSMPLEQSFCVHTILNPDEATVVSDLRYDERFYDNPLTVNKPNLAFYAGVAVKDAQGLPLGTLCVLDTRPRELPELKLESLKALAKLVETHLQLRRTQMMLELKQKQVSEAQPILQRLIDASNISLDKAPISALSMSYLRNEVVSLQRLLALPPR
ncbi:GAF domain-containing protein [Hymenobacter arizonensis]|uniref:GAF domain-containing protein n=1 Tax=Hymenobacter arizonensis TaxID=1227077 RepID=A0A1I6AUB4_HYMAR|nr:GAF domain-containing protein [Hymenobacter arizonensis]SFQ72067.1 GAF domain-containing protein [Hymenobacter arizonensis]